MTDEKPRRGRPPTGIKPLRNIRMSNELWDALKAAAQRHGGTITDIIIRGAERELQRMRRAEKAD